MSLRPPRTTRTDARVPNTTRFRSDLPVRPAWPGVLRARTQVIDQLAAVSLGSGFASGLMPGSVNARMTVSAIPPIPFASALQGDLNYPYGCVVQIASKGYAALEMDLATAKMLGATGLHVDRSEENKDELQSLMQLPYAVSY